MSIRRWLPSVTTTGPFNFGPGGGVQYPHLVISRFDGVGGLYVVNPSFGRRKFESRDEANAWLRANGHRVLDAPERHPDQ